MRQRALSRLDRKTQIALEFAELVRRFCTYDVGMTIHDIARQLNLSPSTKLRAIVTELVEDEVLLCEVEDKPGVAGFRRIYRPNPERFTRPAKPQSKQKRMIRINTHQKTIYEALEGN